MNMKVIRFVILTLTLISSGIFAQEGGGGGLERLKATLEVWERCSNELRSAIDGENPNQIQSQLSQLRNVLVDFPSVQVQVRDVISRLDMNPPLKEELLRRVELQAKFLEDLGREASMALPFILQRETLKGQRQALADQLEALWKRYKGLNDQDNANEQAIYSRIRESWEHRIFGTIAPRFRKELSYRGHIGRPFKDHPGNAALIAAEQEYDAGQKTLTPQINALDRQIRTVVPSTEPLRQLHETFQRQARILDGILITVEPSGAIPSAGGGLAHALEHGSMARLIERAEGGMPLDIESSSEQVARMVLGVTTKDVLRVQGRLGVEGIRRMALGQIDPKWVDVEKADVLIERFLRSDVVWSFETVRPLMRELFTEAIRRPKL